jgi:hypothetical protein
MFQIKKTIDNIDKGKTTISVTQSEDGVIISADDLAGKRDIALSAVEAEVVFYLMSLVRESTKH